MTKSEVIEKISIKQTHLPVKDVELSIKHILTLMSDTLSKGNRIEIRGFGSFSLHHRPSRIGRNPKTGIEAPINERNVVSFSSSNVLKSNFKQ